MLARVATTWLVTSILPTDWIKSLNNCLYWLILHPDQHCEDNCKHGQALVEVQLDLLLELHHSHDDYCKSHWHTHHELADELLKVVQLLLVLANYAVLLWRLRTGGLIATAGLLCHLTQNGYGLAI